MLRRQNNEENNENFDAGLVKSMHPQRKVTSPFNPTPHPNHVSTWIGFNAAQVNGDGVALTLCHRYGLQKLENNEYKCNLFMRHGMAQKSVNKLFQSMWHTQGNRCSLADAGEAAQQSIFTGTNASKAGNVGMVGVSMAILMLTKSLRNNGYNMMDKCILLADYWGANE